MKIGKLQLEGRTLLAPLAGITNLPFRRIVKRCGCSLVCSEMVSVKGMIYNSEKSISLLQSDRSEKPLAIQIFGSEPSEAAKIAAIIEKDFDADLIDINFGCSVKKVVKTGSGVALMSDIKKAENLIKSVRDAISIPLTIKMRSGRDSSGEDAFRIAEIAQRSGVDAITLHPRTASQAFRGKADWSLIKKLKSELSIPLIGNGDVVSAEDGVRMILSTGCDGVMVGRGAMSDPFILSDIEHLLNRIDRGEISQDQIMRNGDTVPSQPSDGQNSDPISRFNSPILIQKRSIDDIFSVMKELIEASVEYFGEKTACRMMRSRLVWFIKGYPGCSAFRKKLASIESLSDATGLINNYKKTFNG